MRSSSATPRHEFVGAHVERANHDGPIAHRAGHAAIGLVMIFFGRLAIGREIEELGAIQPDAVAAALDAVLDLVRKFDIAHQLDAHAVGRFGRQIAQLDEPSRGRPLRFGLLTIMLDRRRIGLQDDRAPGRRR